MIAFALATFLLLVTPGPGVLSVAGVGSGYGFREGFAYLWGLCIGNFLVGLGVATGLAAIVFSVPYVREVLLIASAAYLAYLAAKIAMSGQRIAFITTERAPGLLSGITLQTINPKAYAVNTALFTGFAFMPDSLMLETVLKFVILNAIWIPLHFAWLGAGVTLKKLALQPGTQRAINLCMAGLMLVVAGLAVFS